MSETDVTGTVAAVTVTVQVAVFAPSAVITVMVAVPAALAVTRPLVLTVATYVLDDDQVMVLFVADVGLMVAVRRKEAPTTTEAVFLSRETD